MNMGTWEIALIFLAILLIFGAKRIPEIARGLGKGIREFKDATNDIKQELTVPTAPPPQIQPPAQAPTAQPTVHAAPAAQPAPVAPAPVAPPAAPPPAETPAPPPGAPPEG